MLRGERAALGRGLRVLESLCVKVRAATAREQILPDAPGVRRPRVLSDGLIGQERGTVRMIVLTVDPGADEHRVGADVQKRLRVDAGDRTMMGRSHHVRREAITEDPADRLPGL